MSKIVKLNYGTGSDPVACGSSCQSADWDYSIRARAVLKDITPREMSAYMRGIKLKKMQAPMKQPQPNLPIARGNGVGVI